jgi:CBS domain-containing protein
MIFAIRHLIEGRPKPYSVLKTDNIEKVLSLMTEHEFSQIPVVDTEEHPLGLVTMKSILKAAHCSGTTIKDLDIKVAIEKAKTIGLGEDMHELLNQTKNNESVLVVNEKGKLIGILTHYDTTHFFRKRIEDMLLIEDVEAMAKKLIQWLYSQCPGEKGELNVTIDCITNPARQTKPKFEAAVKAYLGKAGIHDHQINANHLETAFGRLDITARAKHFDDLTLSDYTELLILHPKCPKLGPNLDSSELRRLLTEVREIRNKLMHFRGEISSHEREKLRFSKKWFEAADVTV